MMTFTMLVWVAPAESTPLAGCTASPGLGGVVCSTQETVWGPVLVSRSVTPGLGGQASIIWVGKTTSQLVGGEVVGVGVLGIGVGVEEFGVGVPEADVGVPADAVEDGEMVVAVGSGVSVARSLNGLAVDEIAPAGAPLGLVCAG